MRRRILKMETCGTYKLDANGECVGGDGAPEETDGFVMGSDQLENTTLSSTSQLPSPFTTVRLCRLFNKPPALF